jgi:hypothetical protein
MKLNELRDGQVVRCRTGRAGAERVTWNEWRDAPLFVQRNPKTNDVTVVTVRDQDWAEAGPEDLCEDGILLVEDYYLQIAGLEE